MQSNIHPKYEAINVTCSCGHSFKTRSTVGHDLQVEICSHCHRFYTGKQNVISDTAGRVARFKNRYANLKKKDK